MNILMALMMLSMAFVMISMSAASAKRIVEAVSYTHLDVYKRQTELESGSNWNTMPSHTHERRMEIYTYFELPEGQVVFHMLSLIHISASYRYSSVTVEPVVLYTVYSAVVGSAASLEACLLYTSRCV